MRADLTRAQRQRGITLGLLRALGISAILIALYYLAPLDRLAGVSLLVSMIIGLAASAAMTAYQVSAILRAAHPAVRALEALATTVPLFLVLFAATYFLMSQTNSGNFNVPVLTAPTRSTSPWPSLPRSASGTFPRPAKWLAWSSRPR
jgi:voltage-gated potassium channel